VFSLREPSEYHLAGLVGEEALHELTYGEVGATGDDDMPNGYRHDRWKDLTRQAIGPRLTGNNPLPGWDEDRWVGPPDVSLSRLT